MIQKVKISDYHREAANPIIFQYKWMANKAYTRVINLKETAVYTA